MTPRRASTSSMKWLLALLVSTTAYAEPAEFLDDAKLLYRVAACGGQDAVKPELEKIVDHHCKWVTEQMAKFRAVYFD